jgi:phenylalanyl-tRNA synthetase beta chain
MKISYAWLQKYFDAPLPPVGELSSAITFKAFEIDGVEEIGGDPVLDVKVLPDRTHDCLSYRGIAKEVSAILDIPMTSDPLGTEPSLPATDTVKVAIAEPMLCPRYVAAHMRGVKVGPSPAWLVERLASMGQRSVNNVVDATNFVMFNMGQPLHAFDAGKLTEKGGVYSIGVRKAKDGENMLALDGKEYTLSGSMLVITDAYTDEAVGLAGVKGGAPAGITEATTDIILESANFDGVVTRKTSRALSLRTDASVRFENVISPELAGFGIEAAVALIQKLAGGECLGYTDVYPKKPEARRIELSAREVNRLFGTSMSDADVEQIIRRFGWTYTNTAPSSAEARPSSAEASGAFEIAVPFERLDMSIPEDAAADVGRIYGYERIPSIVPERMGEPVVNKRFYYLDRVRQWLIERGFSEVYTSVFVLEGERQVLNKVDSDRPYLRAHIWPNLQEALEMNYRNRDLLGIPDARLFEIGAVWNEGKEKTMLVLGTLGGKQTPKASAFLADLIKEFDAKMPTEIPEASIVNLDFDSFVENAPDPLSYKELPTLGEARYKPFSRYPFIVRDVSFFAPLGTDALLPFNLVMNAAGPLAVRGGMFDRFEKGDKVSFGFRLIFQAEDRTLTDEEANASMEKVYAALRDKGYEIR